MKHILLFLSAITTCAGILTMFFPGSLIGTSTYMLMGTLYLCTGVIVTKMEGETTHA